MHYPKDAVDKRIEKRAKKDLRAMKAPQLTMEGHKEQVRKEMAKKMESKTYTHSRCGKCNRFGHTHDKCSTVNGKRTTPKMENSAKKSGFYGKDDPRFGDVYER
jgi:hypothetical protein